MRPVTVSPLHLPHGQQCPQLVFSSNRVFIDTQLTLTLNSYTSLELDQSRT